MKIQELIEKRIQAFQADIAAGAFPTQEEFQKEMNRVSNIITATAVGKGIRLSEVQELLDKNFVPAMNRFYQNKPEDYFFESVERNVEQFLNAGNIEEARGTLADTTEMLRNKELVKDNFAAGTFTPEDVRYFGEVSLPDLEEQIMQAEVAATVRDDRGIKLSKENPYDGQNTIIHAITVTLPEKMKNFGRKIKEGLKKHKAIAYAGVAAVVLAAGLGVEHNLHEKEEVPELDSTSISQTKETEEKVEMATFPVDEFHNFNINDEQTHIAKLQLLARYFMERGILVTSAGECSVLTREGKMAVTPEELDNWLISINLEDMDALTFTKLMKDKSTDKEELSADFNKVNNLLGAIYTTKEENPFIYEFIANKEYSNFIKAYENAIITNQKGNSNDLKILIESRAKIPVAGTSSGPIGMLSTALMYQQANVFNAQVVGKDVMDFYNQAGICIGGNQTFFSDDWAEYMRKVDSKLATMLAYEGSEKEAFENYMKTLSDEQDDNKVYIEATVLPYLEKENIRLGEFDVIDWIANNTYTLGAVFGGTPKVTTTSLGTTTRVVSKIPTTPAELAVKEQTEKENAKKDKESFEDVVDKFVTDNNGTQSKDENGDIVVEIPGQEDIIIDTDTMGAYDPDKDTDKPTYNDYNDYKNDHKDKVENVNGVGNVVVEDEKTVITKPNVIPDSIGTSQETDQYIKDNNINTDKWVTTEESEIHYSDTYSYNSTTPDTIVVGDTTNNNNNSNNNSSSSSSSSLDGIDSDILASLTEAERNELKEILDAGKEPVAGEIVSEEFTAVEPETEVEEVASTPVQKETTASVEAPVQAEVTPEVKEATTMPAQQVAPVVETPTDYAAAKAALEAEKEALTTISEPTVEADKTL